MKKTMVMLMLGVMLMLPLAGCLEPVSLFLGGAATGEMLDKAIDQAQAKKVELETLLTAQSESIEAALAANEGLLSELESTNNEAERQVIQSQLEIASADLEATRLAMFDTKNKLIYADGFIGALGATAEGTQKNWKDGSTENIADLAIYGITTIAGVIAWRERKKKLNAELNEGQAIMERDQTDIALVETVRGIDKAILKAKDDPIIGMLKRELASAQSPESKIMVSEIKAT